MSKEEIKKLKDKRTNLATKIKDWLNKGKNAKELAVQYEALTKQLQDLGRNVYISADYLKASYWEAQCNEKSIEFKDDIINTIKPCKLKTNEEHVMELVDNKIRDINYYSLCLAWECKDIHEQPNNIHLIKKCFDDLGLKEISNESYQMGNCIEHISKFRFIGDDNSFKIIKKISQSVLDHTEPLKLSDNKASIFGKKINV